jgi:hypothetical protein
VRESYARGTGSRDGDSGRPSSVNAIPLVVAAMSSRRPIKLIRAPWRDTSADATRATPEETRSLVRRAFWIAGLALVGVAVTLGVLDTTRAQTERWVLVAPSLPFPNASVPVSNK